MKPLGELKVKDYMTRQTIVVDDTAKLTDAIRAMDDKHISVIPIVDNQTELVGILSNSDLIEMMHEIQSDLGALTQVNESTREFLLQMLMEQGNDTRVSDVMTSPVETVSEEANLVVAAQKLNERKFHHLPVVNSSGSSVGIISTSDFVRAIAENGAIAAG